jgi:SAM-dependent methyltransferase
MPACKECKHLANGECAYIGGRGRDSPVRKCMNAIADVHGPTFNGKVLEVGYGVNKHFRRHVHANEDATWYGIDPRWDDPGKNRPKGTAHDIPFDDEFFDAVVAIQSMEHWAEYGSTIEAGIEETYRVLKHGGQFMFNVPMLSHGHPIFVSADTDAILNLFDEDVWDVIHVEEWRKEHEPLPVYLACRRRNKKLILDSYEKCGQSEPSTWVLDVVVQKL